MMKIDTETVAVRFAKDELNKAQRLRRIAGKQYGQLHSVVQDGQPHAKSDGHELEDKLVRQIDAANELQAIQDAINLCDEDSQELLNKRYMGLSIVTNVQIYVDLHYTERAYYRYIRIAFIEFAEAFRGY